MYFKIVVKNLNERIFHIATRETSLRKCVLKLSVVNGPISVLTLGCKDNSYLTQLIETLETDSKVRVLKVRDKFGKYLDFRNLGADTHQPIFDRDSLTLDIVGKETVFA